jgi:hypothetical protein
MLAGAGLNLAGFLTGPEDEEADEDEGPGADVEEVDEVEVEDVDDGDGVGRGSNGEGVGDDSEDDEDEELADEVAGSVAAGAVTLTINAVIFSSKSFRLVALSNQ